MQEQHNGLFLPAIKKPDIRENIGFLEFGGYTGI